MLKRLRILSRILRDTGANKIWWMFVVQYLVTALVIWLREPGIKTFGESMWYCYAVVTTIGFGDVLVEYRLSRVLSVLLSVSAVIVIALITGVIVNFYNQIVSLRQKGTITEFMDKLEHLPELSKEELEELSESVRRFKEIP